MFSGLEKEEEEEEVEEDFVGLPPSILWGPWSAATETWGGGQVMERDYEKTEFKGPDQP